MWDPGTKGINLRRTNLESLTRNHITPVMVIIVLSPSMRVLSGAGFPPSTVMQVSVNGHIVAQATFALPTERPKGHIGVYMDVCGYTRVYRDGRVLEESNGPRVKMEKKNVATV